MIDLTPLDVRKKKGDLPRVMRGYDSARVDEFLDLVAERLEELVRQNMYLSERAEQLESQLSDYRERERSLSDALMSAQELREDSRRQAMKDAELVKREAELEAARIRSGADEAKLREQEAIRRLRSERKQLLTSFRIALERQLSEIDVAVQALGLESEELVLPEPAARGAGPSGTVAGRGQAAERGRAAGGAAEPGAGPGAVPGGSRDAAEQPKRPSGAAGSAGDAAKQPKRPSGPASAEAGPSNAEMAETDWLSSILEEEERP